MQMWCLRPGTTQVMKKHQILIIAGLCKVRFEAIASDSEETPPGISELGDEKPVLGCK